MLKFLSGFLLIITVLFTMGSGYACSTYKVTVGDKTMVGSNYDSWFETPQIWFETNGYGASFTGARSDGEFGFAPQTGMNEFGLAFVTLATATPKESRDMSGKKQIVSRTNYLKDILHTCKTVEEVKNYIDRFDHSTLGNDVFFYVDRSGNYLIVEPYELISGNDAKYVLSNFCPSTITDFRKIKQARYVNGSAFLNNKIDTSIAFCTALSDTMHVCRKAHGDGTLLTSILDLKNGISHLYFYHDYKNHVKFVLQEELAKGNHSVEIASLFPPNSEFKALTNFKTPLNSPGINLFLQLCLILFLLSAILFGISSLIRRKTSSHNFAKLLFGLLSLSLAYYIYLLATEMNIYFFPAPYSDGSLSLVSIASFIPFLLLILIIPILIFNKKILKNSTWTFIPKFFLTLNSITYIVLIVLFSYWGLYNIFL